MSASNSDEDHNPHPNVYRPVDIPKIKKDVLAGINYRHSLDNLILDGLDDQFIEAVLSNRYVKIELTRSLFYSIMNKPTLANEVSQIMTDISRNSSKNDQRRKLKLDTMPLDILGKITSFLRIRQTLRLERSSRILYIGINKNNDVKNICIPDKGGLNLNKYRSVQVMVMPMSAINNLYGRCGSQQLRKLTLLGPAAQYDIEDAFNEKNSIINLKNVESFTVKDFRLAYEASKLQFSVLLKQMPSLKELQVIRSEIDFTEIKNYNLTGLSIDQYDKKEVTCIINIIKKSQLKYLWIKDRVSLAKEMKQIGSRLSKLQYLGISAVTSNTLKFLAQSSLSGCVVSLEKPRSITLPQLKAYITDISKKVHCLKLVDFQSDQLKYTLQGFRDAIKPANSSKIQLIIEKQSISSVMNCLAEIKAVFYALLNHCSHFQMKFILMITSDIINDYVKRYLSRLSDDQLILETVFLEDVDGSNKYDQSVGYSLQSKMFWKYQKENIINFPWDFRD